MAIHTVSIRFTDKPEDQALFQILLSTAEKEYRRQPTRQAKHLLRMALGQRPPDAELLKRMGFPVVTTDDVLCNLERRVAELKQDFMVPPVTKEPVKKVARNNLIVFKGGRDDPR